MSKKRKNREAKKSPYNKFTRAVKKLFGVDSREYIKAP
jgi:hypothetical protein